jgi:hypothetical protein
MAAANPMIAAALKGAGVDVQAVSRMQEDATARGQTSGNILIGGRLVGGMPTAAMPDPLDQLKKVADLHDRGVLTDAEFATEKARLLSE